MRTTSRFDANASKGPSDGLLRMGAALAFGLLVGCMLVFFETCVDTRTALSTSIVPLISAGCLASSVIGATLGRRGVYLAAVLGILGSSATVVGYFGTVLLTSGVDEYIVVAVVWFILGLPAGGMAGIVGWGIASIANSLQRTLR